jgi:hypothetical protein
MDTTNTTKATNQAAATKAPTDILGEIETKLHHLDLLPTATAQWFKSKFSELKAAVTGKPDDNAAPTLADAGASTAAAIVAETTAESNAASAAALQAQSITTITDGVNAGLAEAYPGSTTVKTDDDAYTVVYTRKADNVTADLQPQLFRAQESRVGDFVPAVVKALADWFAGYDVEQKAKGEAKI